MGRPSKYPAEVRERACRLVFEQEATHGSQWRAICSIAEKLSVLTSMGPPILRCIPPPGSTRDVE